jgi:hypothetical protein
MNHFKRCDMRDFLQGLLAERDEKGKSGTRKDYKTGNKQARREATI